MGKTAASDSSSVWSARNFLTATICVLAIFVVVVLVLGMMTVKSPEEMAAKKQASEILVNTLMPIIGTWMGTLLAFYFAKDNFEAANQSVRDLVRQVTSGGDLSSIPVRDAMLPLSKMKYVTLESGKGEAGVNFKTDILDQLQGAITRLPVLDDKKCVRYILHQSVMFRYVASVVQEKPAEDSGALIAGKTLADVLAYDDIGKIARSSRAFISPQSTMAEAKAAMEAVSNCQDVFVTEKGDADSPVLGWVTNTIIVEHSRV